MTPEFGATPWGHGWRRVAEPTALSRLEPALPKARSLARGDRVSGLELAPGRMPAEVDERGRRKVTLASPVWSDVELARARPLLSGVSSSDDLPDRLHEQLASAG